MTRLTHRETAAVLAFLEEMYAVAGTAKFSQHVVTALRKLVPADRSSFNYVHVGAGIRWESVADGAGYEIDPAPIMNLYGHEHPMIKHLQRHRDARWRLISDFITRGQFHRTSLYNEWYRVVGTEYQAFTGILLPGGTLVGIALSRGSREFTGHERLILDLLQPHLIQGYRSTARALEMADDLARLEQGVEADEVGIILLAADHRIRRMTTRARDWLVEYFGMHPRQPKRLPAPLLARVQQHHTALSTATALPAPREAIAAHGAGKCLSARLAGRPSSLIVLLREHYQQIPVARLERLGLSRREAEVLKWAAEGKRDSEIAVILRISTRTVNHHLERVYRKLNVETRTTAVVHALRTVGQQTADRHSSVGP